MPEVSGTAYSRKAGKGNMREAGKDGTLGYTSISGIRKLRSTSREVERKQGKDAVMEAKGRKHFIIKKGRVGN